jgi:hypothetical protein
MKVLSLVEIDLILHTLKLLIPEMENGMLFKQIMMNNQKLKVKNRMTTSNFLEKISDSNSSDHKEEKFQSQ